MSVRVHDFKAHTFALGKVEITGFANDSGVVIDYLSQNFDSDFGSDGDVSVWKIHDPRRTATFTLKHDSPSNDYLSGLTVAGDVITDGTAFFDAVLSDQGGTTKAEARLCLVMSKPSVDIKESSSERTWVILMLDGNDFIGGKIAL